MTHLLASLASLLRRVFCAHVTATRRPALVHPSSGAVLYACACETCGGTWVEPAK